MNTENLILGKSEALFMRYGIRSVTMDDIARELGISKKTLYQFVDNKADLIKKIVHQFCDEEQIALDAIREASTDAIHEMLTMAKHVTQMLRRVKPTAIYDLQKYYRETWHFMEDIHKEQFYSIIKSNLEKGIEEGLYRTDIHPEIIAKFYVGKMLILVDEQIFPLKDFNKEDLFNEFFLYHIRGVASAKGLEALEKHLQS